jgi:virginiamycin B lyase
MNAFAPLYTCWRGLIRLMASGNLCLAAVALATGISLCAKPLLAADPHARIYQLQGAAVPHQIAVQLQKGGNVFFAASNLGAIGRIDTESGAVTYMPLPSGAKPRGLALARDGKIYALDGASDAIVSQDIRTGENRRYAMPNGTSHLELQMGAFDGHGRLWFTGYSGWYGRLDPVTGKVKLYQAAGGRGPFAIAADREGGIWYASYVGNYLARVDINSGKSEMFPLPSDADGPKGIAIDGRGNVWTASLKDGAIARFSPANRSWATFRAPGNNPRIYGITIAPNGHVWASDIGENRVLRFDPATEKFNVAFANLPRAMVRHVAVGQGVIWAAESATDRMIAIREEGLRPSN